MGLFKGFWGFFKGFIHFLKDFIDFFYRFSEKDEGWLRNAFLDVMFVGGWG